MARSLDLIGPDESATSGSCWNASIRRGCLGGPGWSAPSCTAPAKVARVIIWADGEVTAVRASWPRAVELAVRRDDRAADAAVAGALAYTALMATPEVGDRVLLNVAALDRGLGTGVTHW